ncbi:hypothetical protein [Telluribacter sp.]|nr:hypothetical protein [Telluribacter sp.]
MKKRYYKKAPTGKRGLFFVLSDQVVRSRGLGLEGNERFTWSDFESTP